jgi:signal transduction histidine kinase
MDETPKSRIFDSFFTTKFVGRRLGLAVTFRIDRSNSGAIHVSSSRRRGVYSPCSYPHASRKEGRDLSVSMRDAARPSLVPSVLRPGGRKESGDGQSGA